MSTAIKHVDYDALEEQRLNELQKSITERLRQSKDIGHGDNLRHVVLNDVVGGDYDGARHNLATYIDSKSAYPTFQLRVDRFKRYTLDLINAIEAKRNFEGLGGLPLAKQQELYEKVLEHFEELKILLKSIERQEKECRLTDIRSTVWVLKAFMNCAFFLMAFAFFLDLTGSLGDSFSVVFEAFVTQVTDHFFTFIGW
jgi:hypothetical protein